MPDAASMLICGRVLGAGGARHRARSVSHGVSEEMARSGGLPSGGDSATRRRRGDVMLRDAAAVGATEARGRGGARCLVAAARARRAAGHRQNEAEQETEEIRGYGGVAEFV